MPTPVNNIPSAFSLASVQVGCPISSRHMYRLSDECGFNGGYNLHQIASTNYYERNTARTQLKNLTSYKLPFVYYRHPGARVLALVVVLAPGYTTTGTIKIDVTLPTGATWLAANGLDGSTNFGYPPNGRITQAELVGFIDVSGVTAATATFGAVIVQQTVTGVSQAVQRIHLLEIPLAESNVSADPTEPLLEQAWTLSPNRLIDGGSTSPRGLARLAYLMDTYRGKFRPHFQLVGIESTDNTATATNPHWHRDGARGALEWQYNTTGAHDPHFRFYVRNLYGVGGGAPTQTYNLHVRYKTSGATGGLLGTYLSGVGGTSLAAQDLTLAATSNVWTWATRTLTVPADGTGGYVEVYFDGSCTTAGQILQVSNITLVDGET